MKYFNSKLRGSSFRGVRVILAGSLLFALAIIALFQFNGQVVNAGARLMTVTGVDAVFTRALTAKPGSKVAPEVVADTFDGKRASVVIFLAEQADVSAAYKITDQDARGWYVYNTLKDHADRTQGDIKSFLTFRGIEFRSFWVANMLIAEVDRSTAEQIAARSDVARVDSNREARWLEPPEIANVHETSERPEAPTVVEVGVTNTNAPAVWALGFTGQNMIVANQDTGMRWTHNAIKPKYRGWDGTTADHNFNWHDSVHSGGGTCGANAVEPCDDNGHGTHTTGTTVGDDGTGNQVGVAPGAKWIGCRNMNVGVGTPGTYSECFQFFLAPTDLSGNNPNPSLRPHVMNNSWGCPIEEGCTTGAELETIVNNTQAAGIFVVASAGNSGPDCSTVQDAPAHYNASFSVGSISGTTNNLSSFSSRGPSLFYTPNLLKPNISAPGSNVRSSTRGSDTSYGNSSGTSMAGPHVAGVVALLWSARPHLVRDIETTKILLQNTANPNVNITAGTQTCGGTPSTQIPNNSFGYGRVDVLAAYNAAAGSTPTPTNTATSTPVNTATNTATPTSTPTAAAVISGVVSYGNPIGAPNPRFVSNVLISGAGSPPVSTTTDGTGAYSLSGFGAGSYTITPSKTGSQNGSITSFDAARIAQFVVGATTLNAAQQIAANVSGSGGISSFDAALTASYAVGSPNSGQSGMWLFSPASHSHSSVTGNINGENYDAFLMGDVTGNWVGSGSRPYAGNGPERPISVIMPTLLDGNASEVAIPVRVEEIMGKEIISYSFDIRYDPSVLLPGSDLIDLKGTISEGLSFAVNSGEPGILRVAVYGISPISNDGTLLNLRFKVIGSMGTTSPLKWENVTFNEGVSTTVLTTTEITESESVSSNWLTPSGMNLF